jgi:multidrug resistance efflux pump
MIGPKLLLRVVTAALICVAAGCSKQTPAAPETAATPAYVAVARGRIDIDGGLLQIQAPREGTLLNVVAREGELVSKGQLLASIDPEPADLQLQAAAAELTKSRADVQLLKGKLSLAKLQALRLDTAAREGAGDGQSADVAQSAASELVIQQGEADAAVALAEEKLKSAHYEVALRSLRAPLDSRVIRVMAQPGASVSPQSGVLFTLLPQTPPIVRAELSEALVDAVKVGMPAMVSTDGGGAENSWPAHVVRIGSVVGQSTLADDPEQRLNERTVSCVLAFDQVPSITTMPF